MKNKIKKICFVFLLLAISINIFGMKKNVSITTADFPPYISKSTKNKRLMMEIVEAAFAEVGYTVQYKFASWPRGYKMLQNGDVWGTMPYIYTPERAQKFYFSNAIVESSTKFYYYKPNLSDPPLDYTDIKELAKYKIGGVLGYFYKIIFDKSGIKVDYTTSEDINFDKLRVGRIELIIIDDVTAQSLIKNKYGDKELGNFKALKKPLKVANYHLMVSKEFPHSRQILKDFNQGLKKIQENDIYDKIMSYYGLSNNNN